MMRPAEVARRGAAYLERHGVASSNAESEALLQRILRIDRAAMFTRDTGLSTAEAKAFGRALCRRCTGVPLQHLTGEQGFRHLVLEVRPGVFVPRPETEVLVEVALGLVAIPEPVVVDLCTGSGAIALAISSELPASRVYATDLSPDAVTLARANADRLDLPVTIVQGDLFDPLPRELAGTVDLVVANPPYVPIERRDQLPVEVLADPEMALFGDAAGYERVCDGAAAWLRPGGALAVEIDESSGDEVSGILRSTGFDEVRLHPDLAGRDRVVAGRRSP
jgi:release factor glutamine methyltransferase